MSRIDAAAAVLALVPGGQFDGAGARGAIAPNQDRME